MKGETNAGKLLGSRSKKISAISKQNIFLPWQNENPAGVLNGSQRQKTSPGSLPGRPKALHNNYSFFYNSVTSFRGISSHLKTRLEFCQLTQNRRSFRNFSTKSAFQIHQFFQNRKTRRSTGPAKQAANAGCQSRRLPLKHLVVHERGTHGRKQSFCVENNLGQSRQHGAPGRQRSPRGSSPRRKQAGAVHAFSQSPAFNPGRIISARDDGLHPRCLGGN